MGDLHGRLIVFDLDGTLVDSRRDLADSANQLIRERGGAELPEDAIGKMVGEGARVLVERALRAARLDAAAAGDALAQSLARFLEIYDRRLLLHTRPYPGIEEALAAARGHARVAVLTNKPTRPAEAVLEGLGLRSFVDDLVGGDGEWPRKPDPASLHHVMRRAGAVPPDALLIGDSWIDYETATRAGVGCCLATYGFGYATFPVERLRSTDSLVSSASELPPLFEALFDRRSS